MSEAGFLMDEVVNFEDLPIETCSFTSFDDTTIEDLRKRGHKVEVAEPWTVGRLTAASRTPDGLLHAAATPRLMQAYDVGR